MTRSRSLLAGLAAAVAISLTMPAASAARAGAGSAAQRSNVPGVTSARFANAFVTRRGARLYVAGRPFRFAGANAESLGLRNYGPILSVGQKPDSVEYPTRYEVDDVLATLHEMGATVVRAQTIGDTIGCALCLEPSLGHFSARAFDELDMVVAQARLYGIKLIGEFAGDANGTEPWGQRPGGLTQSTDWYCVWTHVSQSACPTATFEDPRILGDYERHMRAILDHVDPYTHLAYKNDPTFLGWVDGNNLGLANPTPVAQVDDWLRAVSAYFKSIDHRQLFIDISESGGDYLPPSDNDGLGPNLGATPSKATLSIPGVDIYGQEWYPKDFAALRPSSPAATQLHVDARAVAAAHKVYATIEFGWDHGNMTTRSVLQRFLGSLVADRNVSGDLFWELVGHSSGHGWEAIPADEHCTPTCRGFVEDGNWWALSYTGRSTAWNTAADMAARAQILRTAAYAMDGFEHTPGHERSPAPIISSTRDGHVQFEGSAGAPDYSIQKLADGRWITPCAYCANDSDDGWQDPSHHDGCYRAIAYNLSGAPSVPSAPAGTGCAHPRALAAAAGSHWVGAWSASQADPGALAGAIPLYGGTGGRTIRNVVHITLGGSRLRIHLSNLFGSRTVRFEDVRVALSAGGAAIAAATSHRVRFNRNTTVAVAPGHQVTSDRVDLPVRAGRTSPSACTARERPAPRAPAAACSTRTTCRAPETQPPPRPRARSQPRPTPGSGWTASTCCHRARTPGRSSRSATRSPPGTSRRRTRTSTGSTCSPTGFAASPSTHSCRCSTRGSPATTFTRAARATGRARSPGSTAMRSISPASGT